VRALVTGGGGFLGSRIAQMLRARGDDVIVLGRRRYPHHESGGIAQIQADLRDAAGILRACRGMDVVFHAGALAGVWGERRLFWSINVDGTRNVIDACRANGVRKLVYTSSPSVVFGREGLRGVNESQPYPTRYLAHYPETKAAAERMVLAANTPDLLTVALRPHLIWGPGDPHLIPRVIDQARKGKLVQVGSGKNLVDITYVDNAAEAHLLAADALTEGARVCGTAYFISQGEPVLLWSWLNGILEALGIDPVKRQVTHKTAWRVGALFELIYSVLRLPGEPRMTRFVALQLATDHYFDISAAAADFGYRPRVSTSEGLTGLLAWLKNHAGSSSPG